MNRDATWFFIGFAAAAAMTSLWIGAWYWLGPELVAGAVLYYLRPLV